jgi:hypothetical protein
MGVKSRDFPLPLATSELYADAQKKARAAYVLRVLELKQRVRLKLYEPELRRVAERMLIDMFAGRL